jgi:hypothetical protein
VQANTLPYQIICKWSFHISSGNSRFASFRFEQHFFRWSNSIDTSICEYGYPQEKRQPGMLGTLLHWQFYGPPPGVPLSIQNFADFSMFVYQNMGKTVYSFDFIGDKPQGRIISFISSTVI